MPSRGSTPVKQLDAPVKQIDTPVKQLDEPIKQLDEPVKQLDVPAEVPDSLAVTDTLALATDSLGADSLAQAAVPPVDSPATPELEPIRLETLYASLINWYPQSPQKPRAQRVLNALHERRDALQALADSLAADSLAQIADLFAADSLAADSLALATDSLAALTLDEGEEAARTPVLTPSEVMRASEEQQRRRMADSSTVQDEKDQLLRMIEQNQEQREEGLAPTDSLAAPSDTSRGEVDLIEARLAAETPAARPDLKPPGPPPAGGQIDWSKGGWTIHVYTETEQQKAEGYARNFGNYLRNTGYAVEVFTALIREEVEYRVGVGLFSSELEAEQALTRLKNRVPGEARIVRIPKTSE